MNASRRSFVRASSLATVAAAIAASLPRLALGQKMPKSPKMLFSLPREVYGSALYNLSRANFYSHINTTFSIVQHGKNKMGLRLYEVADLRTVWGKDRPEDKECFALTFIGPRNRPLSQGTYSLMHTELGPFDLFIVPSDEPDARGLRYEANINRLYP
ncbi:MAG TPA: hypothetical protein VKA60_21230 [Blastocatellia bacterium]|nr:hypothetical protein [Blastocatellia bacterium]